MAILATERVLTLDYWKLARDVKPGDYLFNHDGKPTKVRLVQEYRAQDCYEIQFKDGLCVAGDKHLVLPVENEKYRNRLTTYKGVKKFRRPLKLLSPETLLESDLKNKRNRLIFSVPTAKPLQFPHQNLPVPPFVFGFWFFNHQSKARMRCSPEIEEFVHRKFKDAGYIITKVGKSEYFRESPTVVSHLVPNIPTKIPNNYLLSSAEQRLDLLRGIMHAKKRQYSPKTDTFRFCSYIKTYAMQVQMLAESLGCQTKCFFDETLKNYTVFIKTRLRLIEDQVTLPAKVHQQRRYITSVRPIEDQLCVHIETEDKSAPFLVGEGFITVC